MMLTSSTVVLILTVSICSFFIIHAIIARLWRNCSGQIVALATVVFAFIPMVVTAALCITDGESAAVSWLYLFIEHTSLGYTYFHFFNTSETARRIRLLHEIDLTGGTTVEEIVQLYSTEDILKLRLYRLVQLKQLKYENNRYSISGQTLFYAARIVEEWQYLLGFKRR